MKKLSVIFFLLFISFNIYSQISHNYSRVKIDSKDLERISKELPFISISDCLRIEENHFTLDLSNYEIAELKKSRISFEVEIEDLESFYSKRLANSTFSKKLLRDISAKVPKDWEYGSMGGYLTLKEIYTHMDAMANKYPNLVGKRKAIKDIKTAEGNSVYYLTISNKDESNSNNKPSILFTAAHHAREVITPHVLIYYMYYLLENYNKDEYIKTLVDNREIVFIPCLNPDGYYFNQTNFPDGGGMWRKNRKKNADGSLGIDLNRNYPYQWAFDNKGSSDRPGSETYRGESAASEAEVQAVMHLCNQFNFDMALNLHSHCNMVLYGYSHDRLEYKDSVLYQLQARELTRKNRYKYGHIYDLLSYTMNGDACDYMHHYENIEDPENARINTFAYTVEVGDHKDGFWPPKNAIWKLISECEHMILKSIEMAGASLSVQPLRPLIRPVTGYLKFEISSVGRQSVSDVEIRLETDKPNSFKGNELTIDYLSSGNVIIDSIQYWEHKVTQLTSPLKLKLSYVCDGVKVKDSIEVYEDFTRNRFTLDLYNQSSWYTQQWFVKKDSDLNQLVVSSPSMEIEDGLQQERFCFKEKIDLQKADFAYVDFNTKFDLPINSCVAFEVKAEGESKWEKLKGLNTYDQSFLSADACPTFEGKSYIWKPEVLFLNQYLGKVLEMQFSIYSMPNNLQKNFIFNKFRVRSSVNAPVQLEEKKNTILKVYPQPISSDNILKVETQGKQYDQLIIYNMLACPVFSKCITDNAYIEINTQEFLSGVYQLVLYKDGIPMAKQKVIF
ncbi:MAG: M14 family metallopeptidase [Bacteroidales bacterium]